MKNRIKIVFLVIIILVSCTESNHKNTETRIDNTSVDNMIHIDKIKYFFEWYKDNFDTLSKIQLVHLVMTDSNLIYRVNFDNTVRYINILMESNLFSKGFLNKKQLYFKEMDKNLLKVKQNDGPPAGFEYDLLLYTQEPHIYLNNYNSVNYKYISPNKIVVNNDLIFEFMKKKIIINKIYRK